MLYDIVMLHGLPSTSEPYLKGGQGGAIAPPPLKLPQRNIYITSQYLWKFHSLLFASSPLLYLASLLLPPPPSNTPLEEACSATQNTLINMKEATN